MVDNGKTVIDYRRTNKYSNQFEQHINKHGNPPEQKRPPMGKKTHTLSLQRCRKNRTVASHAGREHEKMTLPAQRGAHFLHFCNTSRARAMKISVANLARTTSGGEGAFTYKKQGWGASSTKPRGRKYDTVPQKAIFIEAEEPKV